MATFAQGKAKDFGFLAIEEEGAQFGLGGGCGDKFEDGTSDVNSFVQFDWIAVNWYATKEDIPTGLSACTWGGQI